MALLVGRSNQTGKYQIFSRHRAREKRKKEKEKFGHMPGNPEIWVPRHFSLHKIYANADTEMKRKAIEKATLGLNPLSSCFLNK